MTIATTTRIRLTGKSFDYEFDEFDDFEVLDYQHHPAIEAPVAA
jgi:thymidylate synthase